MHIEEKHMTEALVSAAWLHAHLDDPDVRPIDVRWYLTERGRGRADYNEAHIPGAAFLDIDDDLAGPPERGPGRHPLPSPEAFAQAASHAGIGPNTHVVAYDASGGAYAARLWWLLRYFGHERVSLLDGGWQAWLAAGYPTESGEEQVPRAEFTPQPQPAMVVNAEQVDALRGMDGTLLIDARAAERYAGRIEPIDPRAGHIPGARNMPYANNTRPDGTWKSPAELRAQYHALGADNAAQVACYCGSGVTAAHDIFALHLAGRDDALLYEGSWSDWSSDPARPAATGADE
jgi:thiosulfate/3-mercaptopyruvate sulfurtransferase